MVVWGDGHLTFGNFGLVRIYQGKGIWLVSLLPITMLASLRFFDHPCLGNWLRLSLVQVASIGVTTNALVVAPLAVSLILFAGVKPKIKEIRIILTGVLSSLPVVMIGWVMLHRMEPMVVALQTDPEFFGYTYPMGQSRSPLIMAALLFLPLMAQDSVSRMGRWLADYGRLLICLLCLPLIPEFASHTLGHVFSWRIFWAWPVPLCISLCVGFAVQAARKQPIRVLLCLFAWGGLFFYSGPLAIHQDNFSLSHIGRHKVVPHTFQTAQRTLNMSTESLPALVAEPVAIWMTGFTGCPPLLGVRDIYLLKLKGLIPDDELAFRWYLYEYVTNERPFLDFATAWSMLATRSVGTIVFPSGHRDRHLLLRELERFDFQVSECNEYFIAIRTSL